MGLDAIIRHAHKPEDLLAQIDLFLLKRPDDYREPGWHPSDFADECVRFLVLRKLLNHKKTFNAKTKRIFDLGKIMHRLYQNDYFSEMGILWGRWKDLITEEIVWGFKPTEVYKGIRRIWLYDEVPIRMKLDGFDSYVVGQADALLVQVFNSVGEIKSTNAWNFKTLKYPMVKHIKQAQIYGYAIREGFIPDCPIQIPKPKNLEYVYINKDTCEEKQFTVPISDVGKIELQKPIQVEQALKDRILPTNCDECLNINSPKAKKCELCSYCFGGKSFDELEGLGKLR
jgi:hypothetical protein